MSTGEKEVEKGELRPLGSRDADQRARGSGEKSTDQEKNKKYRPQT